VLAILALQHFPVPDASQHVAFTFPVVIGIVRQIQLKYDFKMK
jgi:hypothetical protein